MQVCLVSEAEMLHPQLEVEEPILVKGIESYTRLERCDQCSIAQAFYRVEFISGYVFLCRHHFISNEKKIYETALDIVDESDLL